MISIDVETTGLDPSKHSIVSLGALDSSDPANQFYQECRAWEGAEIAEQALAINGTAREDIAGTSSRQSEADLIRAFVAWATDTPQNQMLGAQNVSFDLEFVQAACARAGLACPFAKRTIDTHTLVWTHMSMRGAEPPTKNHHSALNLDAALVYCGVPAEPKPHNALTGAKCHAEVISRIAYTKKLLPEFISYEIPWSLP